MHRFFVPDRLTPEQHQVVLQGTEAHHLARVLRASPGDQVVLLDGSGWEYLARVMSTDRRNVQLEIVSRQQVDRELPVPVILGTALPKAPRQQAMIESLVQLGVSELVPLQSARAVVRPEPKSLQRLRRWVQEATKQCGRTRLAQVAAPCRFSHWIREATPASEGTVLKLLASPGQRDSVGKLLRKHDPRTVDQVRLCIGPEGGFTEEEQELARACGWHLVHLGRRVLRIETAACLLVGAVGLWLEEHS